MSRGNGKMAIFLDDVDYRQFLTIFADITHDTAIDCWNYCLMPNHYHVTLRPTRPNLSAALRRLNGVYGTWWNKRHNRVGHVFQGRFKDQIVDHDTYAMVLSRYVVMNPVRAGLVREPADWPWSSYRATAGRSAVPDFLSTASTLGLFGDADVDALRQRFVKFVSAAPDDDGEIHRIRSNDRILGNRAFLESVMGSDPGLTRV